MCMTSRATQYCLTGRRLESPGLLHWLHGFWCSYQHDMCTTTVSMRLHDHCACVLVHLFCSLAGLVLIIECPVKCTFTSLPTWNRTDWKKCVTIFSNSDLTHKNYANPVTLLSLPHRLLFPACQSNPTCLNAALGPHPDLHTFSINKTKWKQSADLELMKV